MKRLKNTIRYLDKNGMGFILELIVFAIIAAWFNFILTIIF